MIYSPMWGGLKPSDMYPNEFERAVLPTTALDNGITIAAIAKNEGRYIVEWMAYHLAIGVDRIIIYSNDTEDDQCEKIEAISRNDCRVSLKNWPSISGVSPQISAYQDAVKRTSTPWIGFIDIDEFLVPLEDADIHQWLATVPSDVSTVHINWRGFGSGGRETDDYELVTRTFEMACPINWGNHHHFKSIGRRHLIKDVHIHNIVAEEGRRTLSDFGDFETTQNGIASRICYNRIQINHYQCKTYTEFSARMRRGTANLPIGHPERGRDASRDRFAKLDLNEEMNEAIRRFDRSFDSSMQLLMGFLPLGRC